MNILPDHLFYMQAGGILASSEIESEWLETEAKNANNEATDQFQLDKIINNITHDSKKTD